MIRLSASGLDCVRGSRNVFRDVNLELSSGGALALTGPNGSGKSSLLRLIAGLLRPAAGRIELAGGAAERTIAEQAHYLGHLDALKPSLTVAENLGFWARYLGEEAPVPANPALAAVGLGGLAHLPAAYLSAGQRRRLSLARLVAVPRPSWLLDEPSSALAAGGQNRVAGITRWQLNDAARVAGGRVGSSRQYRLTGGRATLEIGAPNVSLRRPWPRLSLRYGNPHRSSLSSRTSSRDDGLPPLSACPARGRQRADTSVRRESDRLCRDHRRRRRRCILGVQGDAAERDARDLGANRSVHAKREPGSGSAHPRPSQIGLVSLRARASGGRLASSTWRPGA